LVRWVYGESFGVELDRDLNLHALADALQNQIKMDGASTDWEVSRLHQVVTQSVDLTTSRRSVC